jgi:hypothetical protein
MPRTVLKQLLGLGLLIASQACAAPAPPTVSALDPNAIDTAIAGTMAAAATQTAQLAALMEKPTSTVTPTKTPSPTPYPTFTLVVAIPRVYVSKSTYCRAGPGQVYQALGALKTGEAVQVVGRSADGKYWIIRNPKYPSQFCWLSGKYANVTGAAGILPVFTPPPLPTPTRTPKPPTHTPKPPTPAPRFKASYSNTVNCTGSQWWVQVTLTNNSSVTFQSIAILMQDVVTGQTFSLVSDDFTASNGCSTDTADTLPPGTTHLVSLPPLTYDPTGHGLLVGISLCSKPGQKGACAVRALDFTP